MSPGNHDYDNYSWWEGENGPGASRSLSGGRVWELYFGPLSRHFADKPWYGGAFNPGLNSYQYFTGGGKRFLPLSLEMLPTPARQEGRSVGKEGVTTFELRGSPVTKKK